MNKTVYIGIIKNAGCDTQTLVKAENEAEALQQVLEKFKPSLNFTEDDVTIVRFSDVHGGSGV